MSSLGVKGQKRAERESTPGQQMGVAMNAGLAWRNRLGWVGVTILAAMVAVAEPAATKSTVAANWLTSYEKAKAQALERHVPILADFSGSDWCGWCIRLDKEVFSEPLFKNYATTNLVLLLVDFPRRTAQDAEVAKQNQSLAEQFGIEGFPTVLLLDASGKELARTGYQPGGADAYVQHLKSLLSKR